MADVKFPSEVWITHTIAVKNWLGPLRFGRSPQAHYVLHSEALSRIAALEAEVDRLRVVVRKRTIEADAADHKAHTAWNDAIEAAAEVFKWNECDLHPKMRKHVIGLIRALLR